MTGVKVDPDGWEGDEEMTKSMTTGSNAAATTETYAAAYARLASIAERLRAGGAAVSVDTLVEDVRAARAAHEVCRARLDAVRREIDAEVAAAESEAEQPRRD